MKQVILKNSVMKQVALLIAIAAVVTVATVALVNGSKSKNVDATAIELAQFEAWKAEQAQKALAENAIAVAPAKTAARTTTARRTTKTYSSPKMVSESTHPAQTTKKKGWSKSAKGAVIGGVVGAGAGAVINKKNRAAGAVIGGILGAGGGYVIGRTMDKKDGRY